MAVNSNTLLKLQAFNQVVITILDIAKKRQNFYQNRSVIENGKRVQRHL